MKSTLCHNNSLRSFLVRVLVLGLISPYCTRTALGANYDDAAAKYYGGNADDDFVDLSNQNFDQVSLMPVSCVN